MIKTFPLDNPDGEEVYIEIETSFLPPKDMHLKVTLPEVTPSPSGKFAWIHKIANCILKTVRFNLHKDDKVIFTDIVHGEWNMIYDDIQRKKYPEKEDTFKKMLGDIPELTWYDTAPKPGYTVYGTVYIPGATKFKLQTAVYDKVSVRITFRPIKELVIVNRHFREHDMDKLKITEAALLVNIMNEDIEG